ncbi:MAG TPA: hypothetical protein VLZ83_13285 [Edaphocola sp.]|nr:hypothetical protein [Edaphocola sp.]
MKKILFFGTFFLMLTISKLVSAQEVKGYPELSLNLDETYSLSCLYAPGYTCYVRDGNTLTTPSAPGVVWEILKEGAYFDAEIPPYPEPVEVVEEMTPLTD